jgi:prephenate dehydrogenase
VKTVDTVAVLGLGLMGGSLARDLAERGLRVVAFDSDPETVAAALESGVVHRALPVGLEGLEDAELVVLAVPVRQGPTLLGRAKPRLTRASLVTDVGSTKLTMVQAAESQGLGSRFVGSHPLTGDERSGWSASRRGLYEGARVFLCPAESAGASAVERARGLWASVGASTEIVTPEAHDEAVAWLSHLPQMVSSALGLALGSAGVSRSSLGPGGQDGTRLAASSAEIWTDIALDNRSRLLQALRSFENRIGELRSAVQSGDEEKLKDLLRASRTWAGGG